MIFHGSTYALNGQSSPISKTHFWKNHVKSRHSIETLSLWLALWIQCTFRVSITVLQLKPHSLKTSPSLIPLKFLFTSNLAWLYVVWGMLNECFKIWTTSWALFKIAPLIFNYSTRRHHFKQAPASSWGPLPWLVPQ